MRTRHIHKADNPELFKHNLLVWSQQFDEVVWLDSNNYHQTYSSYDAVLAVDGLTSIQTNVHDAFSTLKAYQTTVKDWIFGYLAYDLKNDVETLESHNFDGLQFPELYFFQPKKLFLIKGNKVEIRYLKAFKNDIKDDLNAIQSLRGGTTRQSTKQH